MLLLLLLPASCQRQHWRSVGFKRSVHPAAAYLRYYITTITSCWVRHGSSWTRTAAAAVGVHVLRAIASAAAAVK
jgi:hypothetical protein